MKTAINATHTPGPWALSEEDNLQSEIYDRSGELLATAYPMKRDGIHDSWIANARLIAGAPEMLEALEDELVWLNEIRFEGNGAYEKGRQFHIAAVKAAIQKARGGQ